MFFSYLSLLTVSAVTFFVNYVQWATKITFFKMNKKNFIFCFSSFFHLLLSVKHAKQCLQNRGKHWTIDFVFTRLHALINVIRINRDFCALNWSVVENYFLFYSLLILIEYQWAKKNTQRQAGLLKLVITFTEQCIDVR